MAEITEAGLRLAIYARVSTEEQREGQKHRLPGRRAGTLFTREGLADHWNLQRRRVERRSHGKARAGRLRDDAQKALFEAVLINDVDRLARDVAHLGVIKRDLERHGIKVIFRKLPPDTSQPSKP